MQPAGRPPDTRSGLLQSFPLAPMSSTIRVLTSVALALPVVILWVGRRGDLPVAGIVVFLCALYLVTWLAARPTRFEIDQAEVRIRFPVWTRCIPHSSITSVRTVVASAVRSHFGFPLRVGVGGLWGGFGWFWSRRRGWAELYISRTDRLVLIERRDALPLLLTPARPEAFVAALEVVRA
jgi:hypothetical protein